MCIILRLHKFNIYINIYINAGIPNNCLFLKYEVFHEELKIDLTTKIVQYNNTLHTHMVINHKTK